MKMATPEKTHFVVVDDLDKEEEEEGEEEHSRRTGGGSCRSSGVGTDCRVGRGEEEEEEDERRTEIVKERTSSSSSVSDCSVEVDLECGVTEVKVHLAKVERDCRICQLSMDASNQESGVPIELGCSCKDDLAAAHKQCAEAWFKIKGNRTCEICGSTARNVSGANEAELIELWSDSNDATAAAPAPGHQADNRSFWQGHRFLNFMLACMVFAFVISWLFHFNVPS
ncbi:uncharacterized protein LOC110819382 [Carica papaya]|uniref:uncharacterized protein LOC110819382 n=1 Tax=Carica papaya TaxID=3649 RepID=UPI000B8C892F|nr:uncharacterized protein LOC110819382 [Carica papaya]